MVPSPDIRLRPDFLWPVLLAAPVALLSATAKPSVVLAVVAAVTPLVTSFLSPVSGLYILVFSMLLGPEVLVGQLGSGALLGRGVTLRFDDLLLLLVGFGWLGRMALAPGQRIVLRTPLNRPIVWYVVGCVFATLVGVLAGRVRPSSGFFFLLKYCEYFFIYFMTVNIVTDKRDVQRFVTASLVTCGLVSLYAIAQIPSGVRVSAPFEGQEGEPNTLGGYLVFMLAIIGSLIIVKGAVARRWPLIPLASIALVALQATLSRASFLALVPVLLGFAYIIRRRHPLLLVWALIAAVGLVWLLPRPVVDRITYTFNQPVEEGQISVGALRIDTSTSDRLRSWKQAGEVWLTSPLWGKGVTGGPFMDAMYPHVLTETGLIGLAAFGVLLWSLFRAGMTGYHLSPDPYLQALSLGFVLGFLGMLVHAIGSNTFIIVRIMEPFWLFAGLVVKGYRLASPTEPGKIPNESESRPNDLSAERQFIPGLGPIIPR
jgi:O-antigen ligase